MPEGTSANEALAMIIARLALVNHAPQRHCATTDLTARETNADSAREVLARRDRRC